MIRFMRYLTLQGLKYLEKVNGKSGNMDIVNAELGENCILVLTKQVEKLLLELFQQMTWVMVKFFPTCLNRLMNHCHKHRVMAHMIALKIMICWKNVEQK